LSVENCTAGLRAETIMVTLAIAAVALGGATLTPDTALIDNARHRRALEEALDAGK
jgi:hypothetical protein